MPIKCHGEKGNETDGFCVLHSIFALTDAHGGIERVIILRPSKP